MNAITEPDGALHFIDLEVPSFYMNRIGLWEPYGRNCLRFVCCTLSGDMLIPQFQCILPIKDVVLCAKEAIEAASRVHNMHAMTSGIIC